jgi:hypothetical protein
MSELLGAILGVAVGGSVSCLRPGRLRAVLLVPVVLIAGIATSAINGELDGGLWPVFVSFDTLVGRARDRRRLLRRTPPSAGSPTARASLQNAVEVGAEREPSFSKPARGDDPREELLRAGLAGLGEDPRRGAAHRPVIT